MLWLTCLALLAVGAMSCLSRSALTWCVYLALMLAGGRHLSLSDLYPYLCALGTAMLLMMLGSRQPINRAWQEPVIMLQCGILLLYVAFNVLGKSMLWLTIPFIDVANVAFLAQLMIVGLGGIMNSVRNYKYAMARKDRGDSSSLWTIAWRLT